MTKSNYQKERGQKSSEDGQRHVASSVRTVELIRTFLSGKETSDSGHGRDLQNPNQRGTGKHANNNSLNRSLLQ